VCSDRRKRRAHRGRKRGGCGHGGRFKGDAERALLKRNQLREQGRRAGQVEIALENPENVKPRRTREKKW